MKIVIAANRRMRQFARLCLKSVKKLGYDVVVYDLGGLGFGKPFKVDNPTFQKKGYYHEIKKGRYAPGNHKPAVIKDCLDSYKEFIVYLDADTVVLDRIDEMVGDYDVGLTVRPEWEIEKVLKNKYDYKEDYFIYDGYVNSGVMCFNATEATYRFVKEWESRITELRAEQGVINTMLKKYFPLKSDQIIEMEGIKIRTFDTLLYNYYYFNYQNHTKDFIYDPEKDVYLCPNHKELTFRYRAVDDEGNSFSAYCCPASLPCKYFGTCTKKTGGRKIRIYDKDFITKNELKIKWPDAKILHFKGEARSEYHRIISSL